MSPMCATVSEPTFCSLSASVLSRLRDRRYVEWVNSSTILLTAGGS